MQLMDGVLEELDAAVAEFSPTDDAGDIDETPAVAER